MKRKNRKGEKEMREKGKGAIYELWVRLGERNEKGVSYMLRVRLEEY